MASFVYRKSSDGAVLDPSRALGDMVRKALRLGADSQVAIMQMQCGSCGDPACGDVETIVRYAPDQAAPWRQLRIAAGMRLIEVKDIVAAAGREADAASP